MSLRRTALSGSLRVRSTTGELLEAVAGLLDPAADTARAGADALLVVSPEYAHGGPGSLGNALDRLVGGPELSGLPTAVDTGSPAAAGGACLAAGATGATVERATGRVAHEPAGEALRGAVAARP